MRIVEIEETEADGIVIRFSDGTAEGFLFEELFQLRVKRTRREPIDIAVAREAIRRRVQHPADQVLSPQTCSDRVRE